MRHVSALRVTPLAPTTIHRVHRRARYSRHRRHRASRIAIGRRLRPRPTAGRIEQLSASASAGNYGTWPRLVLGGGAGFHVSAPDAS
eukprot:5179732-Prymnesium_polylepis.1